MENSITHYCQIKDGQIIVDDQCILKDDASVFTTFIKNGYKKLEMNYPKFYKMDPLCKLAIVGAEALLTRSFETIPDDLAIILANKSSCIDVDKKHQAAITKENGYASPADFVYTLPNIALGEISIKYNLKTENTFFIFDNFNASFFEQYINGLIESNRCCHALGGWVEVNENAYNALLFTVETGNKEGSEFNANELTNLIE